VQVDEYDAGTGEFQQNIDFRRRRDVVDTNTGN
jgi:hypothetical protein